MFQKKYTHRTTNKRVFTFENEPSNKNEDTGLPTSDTDSLQTAKRADRDDDDGESPMICEDDLVHVPVIQDFTSENGCQGMEVQCEVEVTSTPLNSQLFEEDAVPLTSVDVPDQVEEETDCAKETQVNIQTKESDTEYIISCEPVMSIKDFEKNMKAEENGDGSLNQGYAKLLGLQSTSPLRSAVKADKQGQPEEETPKDKGNTPKHSKQMLTLPPLCSSTPRLPRSVSITQRQLVTEIIDFDTSPVIVKQHKTLNIQAASKDTSAVQKEKIVENTRRTKTEDSCENTNPEKTQSGPTTVVAQQKVTKDDLVDQMDLKCDLSNQDKFKDDVVNQIDLKDDLVSDGDLRAGILEDDFVNKKDLSVGNKSRSKTLVKSSGASATNESESDKSTSSKKKLKLSREALGLMEQNRKMSSIQMTDSDSYFTSRSSYRSLRPKNTESESSDKVITKSLSKLNKRKKKRKFSQKPSKSQVVFNPLTSESETNIFDEHFSEKLGARKQYKQRKYTVTTVDQGCSPLKSLLNVPIITSPESGPCMRNTSRNKSQSHDIEIFSVSSTEVESSPNLKHKNNQQSRQTFSNLFTYSTYDKSSVKKHSVKSRLNAKQDKISNLPKKPSNKSLTDNLRLSPRHQKRSKNNNNQLLASNSGSLNNTSGPNAHMSRSIRSVLDDQTTSNSQHSKHFISSLKHLTMMKPDFSPQAQKKSKELFTRRKKAKYSSYSKSVINTPVSRKRSVNVLKVSQPKTFQPPESSPRKNIMKEKEILRYEELDNEIEEICRHEDLEIEGLNDKELQKITSLWSHQYQNLKETWPKKVKRNKIKKYIYIGEFPDEFEDSPS